MEEEISYKIYIVSALKLDVAVDKVISDSKYRGTNLRS